MLGKMESLPLELQLMIKSKTIQQSFEKKLNINLDQYNYPISWIFIENLLIIQTLISNLILDNIKISLQW